LGFSSSSGMKGVEAFMARSWAVLTVMLAVLLAAAPALLAQEVPASAGSEVEATGYLSPVYPRDAYSHLLNDETTGATYFARSENVDLNSCDDVQRVDVTGTLVVDEGYPEPILQVTGVEPVEDPTLDGTATLTFKLSVKGNPTSDATFFGTVSCEGPRYVPLTDEDGDGLYTGSTTVSRFPPGQGRYHRTRSRCRCRSRWCRVPERKVLTRAVPCAPANRPV
jgi:hypothetical protein